MKLIYAVNNLGYIGKNGELMWRSSEDFKYFKSKTMGGILIVGRTTFEKDLKGRMLPGRKTLVVGTGYMTLAMALETALMLQNMYWEEPHCPYTGEIWVIGGASIYNQLVPFCTEIYRSVINDDQVGDTKFEVPAGFKGKIIEKRFEKNAI